MGRLSVYLFGQELVSIEAHLFRRDDGGGEVRPGPEPAAEPAPVQTGVSGLADTAFGEHADPGTVGMGFGQPLRAPDRSAR